MIQVAIDTYEKLFSCIRIKNPNSMADCNRIAIWCYLESGSPSSHGGRGGICRAEDHHTEAGYNGGQTYGYKVDIETAGKASPTDVTPIFFPSTVEGEEVGGGVIGVLVLLCCCFCLK